MLKTRQNRSCKFETFAWAVFFYAQKSKGNLVKHISAKLTCIPPVVRLECVGMLKCPKISTLYYLQDCHFLL